MGIASKILVKYKENSNNTIKFILRVQHVKDCKNYVWLNYRSKIVWAIFLAKGEKIRKKQAKKIRKKQAKKFVRNKQRKFVYKCKAM